MAEAGGANPLVEEEEVPVRPPNPINDIQASIKSVQILSKRVVSAAEDSSDSNRVFEDAEQLALAMLVSIHNLEKDPKDLPYKVPGKLLSEMTQAGERIYAAVVCLTETCQSASKWKSGNAGPEPPQDLVKKANDGVTESIDEILSIIETIEEGEDGEEENKKKGEATGGEGGYDMAEIQQRPGLSFIFKLATEVAEMISSLQEQHASLTAEQVLEKAKEREGAISLLVTLSRKFARCRADGSEQQLLLDTATKVKTASTALLAAQKAVLSRPKSKPDQVKYVAVAEEFSTTLLKLLQLLIQIKNSQVKTSHRLYIWDEMKAEGVNITMDINVTMSVSAGTLNQLIVYLTNPSTQDPEFQNSFIATFSSFTNPDELFTKLLQRYSIPRRKFPDLTYKKWKETWVLPIQKKVIEVLKAWVRERFQDFTYVLIKRLNEFIETRLFQDGYGEEGQEIFIQVQENIESIHKSYVPAVPPLQKSFKIDAFLLGMPAKALAEQMAVNEFVQFKRIQQSELLDLNWKNPKQKHRAPNISRILDQNVVLSGWVSHAICTTKGLKKRVEVYTKLVNLAQASFSLHNYSSCKAIVLGLSRPAVDRLKFTKEKLPAQTRSTLAALQERLRPEDSHANLQKIMRTDKLPVVPYLPILLENLAVVEEGAPDKVGNLINFKKRLDCYAVLKQIRRYQGAEMPIVVTEDVRSVLENLPSIKEEATFRESLEREGRGQSIKEVAQ